LAFCVKGGPPQIGGGSSPLFLCITLAGVVCALWTGTAAWLDWMARLGMGGIPMFLFLLAVSAVLLLIGVIGLSAGLIGQPGRLTRWRVFVGSLGITSAIYLAIPFLNA
jgi:hypothetical protein